ncbi:MAG: HAD-IB family phosphatase [Pacificimonas sp.]
MDRTITKSGTYSPWLWHWSGARAKWRRLFLPLSLVAGLGYVFRLVSRGRLKEINHWLLMGGRSDGDAVENEAGRFADRLVPDQCFASALEQIEAEKAEGRRVIVATASYAFYARAICARAGVEEVIGTRVQRNQNGDVLARISGENCYDAAKLRMVEDYLAADGIDRNDAHVRFFSDHHSDEPMFAWADEAYAVNGKAKMNAMAKARGWQIPAWT